MKQYCRIKKVLKRVIYKIIQNMLLFNVGPYSFAALVVLPIESKLVYKFIHIIYIIV